MHRRSSHIRYSCFYGVSFAASRSCLPRPLSSTRSSFRLTRSSLGRRSPWDGFHARSSCLWWSSARRCLTHCSRGQWTTSSKNMRAPTIPSMRTRRWKKEIRADELGCSGPWFFSAAFSLTFLNCFRFFVFILHGSLFLRGHFFHGLSKCWTHIEYRSFITILKSLQTSFPCCLSLWSFEGQSLHVTFR